MRRVCDITFGSSFGYSYVFLNYVDIAIDYSETYIVRRKNRYLFKLTRSSQALNPITFLYFFEFNQIRAHLYSDFLKKKNK